MNHPKRTVFSLSAPSHSRRQRSRCRPHANGRSAQFEHLLSRCSYSHCRDSHCRYSHCRDSRAAVQILGTPRAVPTGNVISIIVLVTLTLATGCGTATDPATVPASGFVQWNGNPIEGAVVVFHPATPSQASQQAAQAITGADGGYEMQTYDQASQTYLPGIAPNDYVVTITKQELPTDMQSKPKHLLPKKYRTVKSSPLRVTVGDGEKQFDFDLE